MSGIEYVLVGDHAENLTGGAMLAPGERVSDADLDLDRTVDGEQVRGGDQWLIDDEKLLDVSSFEEAAAPTLADLKVRASELEIEGRSKMSAEELAEAISAREQELAASAAGTGDSPEVTQ